MDLDVTETEVLWSAIEGSFLIELRQATGLPSAASVELYRAGVGAALVSLLSNRLVDVGVARWPGSPREPIGILTLELVVAMLADGSAWDPGREELIVLNATESGLNLLTAPRTP